jgi:thiol:disulfide interchange protein
VRAAWAAAALEMERTTWKDPRVVDTAKRFIALQLDVTQAEGAAELTAQRFDVEAIPSVLVLDPSGRRVAAISGLAEPSRLLAILQGAADP